MKKLIFLLLISSSLSTLAQDSTAREESDDKPSNIPGLNMAAYRPRDHLLIQIGYLGWSNKPDSIQTDGLPRTFNIYFMFDFPFKTNPKFSVGLGAGVGTDNMYFENTYVDVSGKLANRLSFQDVSDTTHFKKFKLLTSYLEVPVELRFTSNPLSTNKSVKIALGAKIGTMVAAGTKGKDLLNSNGQSVNSYTQKEKAKRYFNTTRLSAMARVGYGTFNLFASYQINSFIKDGFGPDIRPYVIGLTISGL